MWVPIYTLTALLGEDNANALCEHMGGVGFYVPQMPQITHPIAKIIGLKGMGVLCAEFQGEYITVPIGRSQKERIIDLLEKGMPKQSIARICGVTERYVYTIAALTTSDKKDPLPLLHYIKMDKS